MEYTVNLPKKMLKSIQLTQEEERITDMRITMEMNTSQKIT